MSQLTNFFTAVNARYEHFLPIYAYSVLSTNPDAIVEVAVEDPDRIRNGASRYIEVLEKQFPSRLFIRPGEFDGILPNSVRFLETPEQELPYTYIGDADIIVLEHVTPWHLNKLDELGLPHTNIIRSGTKNLSGLHFCQTSFHYPIDHLSSRAKGAGSLPDELFLYHIYETKDALPPLSHQARPQHGIHTSLNRYPLGSPGWGASPAFVTKFEELFNSSSWREVAAESPAATNWIIKALQLAIEAQQIFPAKDLSRIKMISG